jgi:hypothetical protein
MPWASIATVIKDAAAAVSPRSQAEHRCADTEMPVIGIFRQIGREIAYKAPPVSNKCTRPIEPTTQSICHLQQNSLTSLMTKRAIKPKADFNLALARLIECAAGPGVDAAELLLEADDAGNAARFVGLRRS